MRKTGIAFANKKIKKSFEELKKGKFEDRKIYEFLEKAKEDLKTNSLCGTKIAKKLIPQEYIKKYNVNNLWKYDLPNAWRLLYTVEANEVLIIAVILEWMNHKNYEKRFKYK